MMYSADKHYSHLDPSEPIPEIELRYAQDQLRMTRLLVRRMPYVLAMLVLLAVAFIIWEPALWARWTFVGVLYAIGLFHLIRTKRRVVPKKMNRETRQTLDMWSIPVSLMINQQVYWIGILVVFMHLLDANAGSIQAVLMLGFYAFSAGLVLTIASRSFRQPGQISCERCFYPLVGLTLPTSCPECGRAILNLSFATDRPKLRDKRYLVAGIILTAFGVLTIYVQFVKPTWLYAPFPRSMLIPLAARDRDAFDRLVGGSLTAAEEQQLLDAMIANSTTSSYRSSFDQGQWIEAQIFAGKLSDQQLDALFMPTTEIEIDAPDRARVGQPVELRLRGKYVRLPSFSTTPGYYFRGFVVGDSGTAMGGSNEARFRLYLTDSEYEREPDVPVATWTATEHGPVRVRARVVLALFPGGGRAARVPIDWSSPDSLFSTAPVWSHVVDLEHTITVVE